MMKNNHGHIVTIASVAGLLGIYNCTDYSATKFAAIGCHESLFTELKVCNHVITKYVIRNYRANSVSSFHSLYYYNYHFIDICTFKVHGYEGIHMTLVCPYLINTGMFNGVKPRFVKMRLLERNCTVLYFNNKIIFQTD